MGSRRRIGELGMISLSTTEAGLGLLGRMPVVALSFVLASPTVPMGGDTVRRSGLRGLRSTKALGWRLGHFGDAQERSISDFGELVGKRGGVGRDSFSSGRTVLTGLRGLRLIVSSASHLRSVLTLLLLFLDLVRLLWALANCQRAGSTSADPVALWVWLLALSSMMATVPEWSSITLRRCSIEIVVLCKEYDVSTSPPPAGCVGSR